MVHARHFVSWLENKAISSQVGTFKKLSGPEYGKVYEG